MRIFKISNTDNFAADLEIKKAAEKKTDNLQKTASIRVNSGRVICPLAKGNVSTVDCELCQYCSGSFLKTASMEEYISCSYNKEVASDKVKTASVNAEVNEEIAEESDNKFAYSQDENKSDSEVSLDDFRLFSDVTKKAENLSDEEFSDLMRNKIVSGQNVSDFSTNLNHIKDGTNSIFDSDAIGKFDESEKAKENQRSQDREQDLLNKSAKKEHWLEDARKELAERAGDLDIDAFANRSVVRNITSSAESNANNPDVSSHQFSIFDTDLVSKMNDVPEKTDGEKLAESNRDRVSHIQRQAKADRSWDSIQKSRSSDDLFNDMFDRLNMEREAPLETEESEVKLSTMDSFIENITKNMK